LISSTLVILMNRSALTRGIVAALAVAACAMPTDVRAQNQRPTIGVAFGGGSARGIAHIGVIRWFEEHRIPIDVAAGTSMGGLVGGAYATGMSADELRTLIEETDWDVMFGSSSFPFKNIRRKEDERAYPSRLEFGLKRGIVAPTSLNNGQQVDLLLARIAGAYYAIDRFDELPTPFRVVALDLRTAERVVLDRGSLADAMRATMSLPGIFPPTRIGEWVLVDGGTVDNVPADVVREMGATVAIAIDVGFVEKSTVDFSLFGLLGGTVDAMMRGNTRRALASADHIISVDVASFGSLDWRRSADLIERGYQAADRMSADLVKYALSEADWQVWVESRKSRRRTSLPQPQYLSTAGLTPTDAALARRSLAPLIDKPFNIPALQHELAKLSGLDRYQTINWQVIGPPGREGLLVRAREKTFAPPFLMLGVNLENTTSDQFTAQLAARYLAFDVGGSGAELRIDGAVGSNPSIGAAWYRPITRSRVFGRLYTGSQKQAFNFFVDDNIVASYTERRLFAGGDVGVNTGRVSEVSGGIVVGRLDASVQSGDPGLPELNGLESLVRLRWVFDGQDSPVVPSRGVRLDARAWYYLQSPEATGVDLSNDGVTQAAVSLSSVWTKRRLNRLFLVTAGGTSFDGDPLPTEQFTVGVPFLLDAFTVGERRGNNFAVVTAGVLRQIFRLPDFLGGPMFAGLWLENGTIFNDPSEAEWDSQLGAGAIMDTLVGPVLIGVGVGLNGGGWRTFFGVGQIFR
jgi:NTE family protein